MIDLKLIKEHPEKVKKALGKRGLQVDFQELFSLDQQRREVITQVEGLKAKRNQVSSQIPNLLRNNQPTGHLKEEMKHVSGQIKNLDGHLAHIEARIAEIMDGLPNMPDEDVLPGGKENNQVIREWGEKPEFSFASTDHVSLAEGLDLIDYNRGVKLGGANFWMYTGQGALLEWSLLNYFIESHLQDGYQFILPPHILLHECGYAAGQFPKFSEEVFFVSQKGASQEERFLLPTAETALINMHRDEILDEDELPKKYFAYTPCYRAEVGSYRSADRGTMRGHQFNKVEMFQFTLPENSDQAHLELLSKAEKLVQGLGLHYQVTKLAAEDMGGAMAKTFDVEIWIPSLKRYVEVSSISNARDYQARRGKIRFRRSQGKRIEYVHTLNASGLATSRLFVGLIEQNQQAGGALKIPAVLQKWVGRETLSRHE